MCFSLFREAWAVGAGIAAVASCYKGARSIYDREGIKRIWTVLYEGRTSISTSNPKRSGQTSVVSAPTSTPTLLYSRRPTAGFQPPQKPTMAILSAQTLLRTLTLFHLTLAYYLLTSPATIASQNLVYVLGAAMEIPEPPISLSTPSPASTLAALFLALLALSDLTSSGLPEEVGSHYWSNQAPVRLAFFFAVTGYSYAAKPGGLLGGKAGRGGEVLCNSVVFTWGFLEMLLWFWVSGCAWLAFGAPMDGC